MIIRVPGVSLRCRALARIRYQCVLLHGLDVDIQWFTWTDLRMKWSTESTHLRMCDRVLSLNYDVCDVIPIRSHGDCLWASISAIVGIACPHVIMATHVHVTLCRNGN